MTHPIIVVIDVVSSTRCGRQVPYSGPGPGIWDLNLVGLDLKDLANGALNFAMALCALHKAGAASILGAPPRAASIPNMVGHVVEAHTT